MVFLNNLSFHLLQVNRSLTDKVHGLHFRSVHRYLTLYQIMCIFKTTYMHVMCRWVWFLILFSSGKGTSYFLTLNCSHFLETLTQIKTGNILNFLCTYLRLLNYYKPQGFNSHLSFSQNSKTKTTSTSRLQFSRCCQFFQY